MMLFVCFICPLSKNYNLIMQFCRMILWMPMNSLKQLTYHLISHINNWDYKYHNNTFRLYTQFSTIERKQQRCRRPLLSPSPSSTTSGNVLQYYYGHPHTRLTISSFQIENDDIEICKIIEEYEHLEITLQQTFLKLDASVGSRNTFLLNSIIYLLIIK